MEHMEYAIRDHAGVFWGLPAKQFDSPAAAAAAMTWLKERRADMEREAVEAVPELAALGDVDSESPIEVQRVAEQRIRALKEAIERWEREQPRVWQIVKREIGPWKVVR